MGDLDGDGVLEWILNDTMRTGLVKDIIKLYYCEQCEKNLSFLIMYIIVNRVKKP
jgi:hypothetical protein